MCPSVREHNKSHFVSPQQNRETHLCFFGDVNVMTINIIKAASVVREMQRDTGSFKGGCSPSAILSIKKQCNIFSSLPIRSLITSYR